MKALDSNSNLEQVKQDLAAWTSALERHQAAISAEQSRRRLGANPLQPITPMTDLAAALSELSQAREEVKHHEMAIRSESTIRAAKATEAANRQSVQAHQNVFEKCAATSKQLEQAEVRATEAEQAARLAQHAVNEMSQKLKATQDAPPDRYATPDEVSVYNREVAMWQEQLQIAESKQRDARAAVERAWAERNRLREQLADLELTESIMRPTQKHTGHLVEA